jgi:hypothetical protein
MPDPTLIEAPDVSHIRPVRLRIDELKRMSDAQLLAVLNGEAGLKGVITGTTAQLITAELHARALAKASKPHWSAVPSFWLLVISTSLTFLAVVLTALALPQVQQYVFPAQQQSQTPKSSPPDQQHSQTTQPEPQKK